MPPFAAFVLGAVAGVAAASFGAGLPEVRRYARPTAKLLLKTTMATVQAARVQFAELAEDVEDLFAETQSEMMQEAMAQSFDAGETADAGSEAEADEKPKPAKKRKANKSAGAKRTSGKPGRASKG